jgi:hypothetical protein
MKVIYDSESGSVIATGDAVAANGEDAVFLDESKVSTPIESTFVDDVESPSKTTPDIDKLRLNKIESIKDDAHDKLEPTDWYVIRKMETGESIPHSIKGYRESVKSTVDMAESDVAELNTPFDIVKYNPEWPDKP